MRYLFFPFYIFPFLCFSQTYDPIPKSAKNAYHFNLQKNFFLSENAYRAGFRTLVDSLNAINIQLDKKEKSVADQIKILSAYNKAEASYRVSHVHMIIGTSDKNLDEIPPLLVFVTNNRSAGHNGDST
jgi:hypothetical protein